MNINVHIERLILDGLPLASSQGPLVQAAVEAELTRLLSEGAVRPLSAGAIQLTEDSQPAQLGQQIAEAIHAGLGSTPARPRQTPPSRGARK